jgi:hypothetical protein
MRRLFAFLLLLAAIPAAAHQPRQPEWRQATEQQVLVEVGSYQPDPLVLEAGRPTRLVFVNNSRARLSLYAKEFFGNSTIRAGDDARVRGGGFLLDPGETVAVTLVPGAGRYTMRSGSFFRNLLGMNARIIVQPPRQRSEGRPID